VAGVVGQAGLAGVVGQAGLAGVVGQAGLAGVVGQAGAASASGAALTVVAGSATDAKAVAAVVDGADAVLSALGPRGAKTPDLLGGAGRNIIAAMDQAGSRRLICVSAAGAFIEDDPDMGALMKMILPRVLAKQFADVRAMEAVVSASGLDWTLVRPTRLVNTPQTGRYRARPDYAPPGGRKISRADVAHFIGTTLEQGSWLEGRPALAY
jgi:putative NADH-flavin reductase